MEIAEIWGVVVSYCSVFFWRKSSRERKAARANSQHR
jgi:hypothetical protein